MIPSRLRLLLSGWPIRFSGFLITLTLPCLATTTKDDDPNANRVEAPYFQVEGGDDLGLDAFPLKSTKVKTVISGIIADVTVTQVYGNASHQPVEAVYVFPASVHCAVHGLEMKIGDQITKAVIKEREDARATYEQAKSARKNASLLEQERPNVFKMSVANILPGDEVEVTLQYTEYLQPKDGTYEYVFPTVAGPRYPGGGNEAGAEPVEDWVANPYLEEGETSPAEVALQVQLNAGMPLQQVSCVSHETAVEYQDPSSASVKVKGRSDTIGNRDFILRYQLAGREIQSGLLLHEAKEGAPNDDNFFLLTVQPPERVGGDQIVPRDYVFVMDVSGSMRGFPLDVSKALLQKLIGELKPHETFNVLLFAGSSQSLSRKPLQANDANIRRALQFIDQPGGGSTNLLPALKSAYALPKGEDHSRSIVIVTDGYVTVESQAFDMVREELGQANVFAFGIGSSVNRFLIEGLARAGHGEPFVITTPSEAKSKAAKFREYIEAPVLTEISVKAKGFEAYDIEPRSYPDVFSKRPLVVYGKWKGPLEGRLNVRGRLGNGSMIEKVFSVKDEAKLADQNPALPYLWARERIAHLSDYAGSAGQSNKSEVTQLGLTYNLLTAHTSFVAVQEKVREFNGQATMVKQPLPLPQGVSNDAIAAPAARMGNPVAITATPVGMGGGTNSIPEPSSALLVLIAALIGLLQRRR